jgi:TetR/AcrR family transcriptional repressor of nem operon
MSRYTPQHKEETKRRILAAADELIKAEGVASASVAEVMARAGLTVGGFYAYFPSKDALAHEALLFGLTRIVERMLASLDRIPDPKARVRALIVQYLAQAEDPNLSHACPMTLLLPELATHSRRIPGSSWTGSPSAFPRSRA